MSRLEVDVGSLVACDCEDVFGNMNVRCVARVTYGGMKVTRKGSMDIHLIRCNRKKGNLRVINTFNDFVREPLLWRVERVP